MAMTHECFERPVLIIVPARGADYNDNATSFNDLDPNTSIERSAKAATHVGDASVLNVWTTNGQYLGFATAQSWYKHSPELGGPGHADERMPGGQGHVPRARRRPDPQLYGLLVRLLLQPVHGRAVGADAHPVVVLQSRRRARRPHLRLKR
jgi:hypothetical protein